MSDLEPPEASNSEEGLGIVGDDYVLKRKIAEGGMGSVYHAWQKSLGREVAVKILPKEMVNEDIDSTARFMQESSAMAGLNHPHIVAIYGRGETEEGDPWFAMEYVDGHSIHEYILAGKLTTDHVYAWIPMICDALDYAPRTRNRAP